MSKSKTISSDMSTRKWIITIVCLFLQYGHSLLPPIMGLNEKGMGILCIFVGTMIMLLFVNLTWPVVSSILAFSLTGVYGFDETIRMSFGNQVIWFVAFSGMIFSAMRKTGALNKLAIWMISRPFTKKNPWYFVYAVWVSCFLLGLIIDVVALIMLYTALLLEIFDELGIKKGDRFAELFLVGVLVVTGLSYGCTPIGHIIPMLAISFFEGYGLNFAQYTVIGTITGTIALIPIFFIFKKILKMDVAPIRDFDPTTLQERIKEPWTKEQIASGIIYLLMVVLWLVPSLTQYKFPAIYHYFNSLTNCMPIFLGVLLMCLIHINGKPLMNFDVEIREGSPWSAVFVVIAAILLGVTLNSPEGGIPVALNNVLSPLFKSMPSFLFVLLIGFLCNVMTNFSSDTVTLLLISSITLPLIEGGAVSVSGATMGIIIGILSCTAYMTPPASSYAAYTAGTGWVSVRSQFLYGMLGLIATTLVIVGIGYPLSVLLFFS